jgi:hypothetical protein
MIALGLVFWWIAWLAWPAALVLLVIERTDPDGSWVQTRFLRTPSY